MTLKGVMTIELTDEDTGAVETVKIGRASCRERV